MITLSEKAMSTLRSIEMDILREIVRICEKCHIQYSLAGGSLLGAVRHSGFIPWDDDIDVMMLRPEYGKFLTCAAKEMSNRFYIENWDTNKHYGLPFTKIMAKNTVMLECSNVNTQAASGVYVDLFPVDVSPVLWKDKKRQWRRARKIRSWMLCRNGYYFGFTGFKQRLYSMRGKLLQLMPVEFFIEAYNRIAMRYRDDVTCTDMINLFGIYGLKRETIPKSWYESYTNLEFEGLRCMVISNYDGYLTQIYGDYMTFPPVEQQIPHHLLEKFEVYNDFS